jgi:hypothetical protein
MRTRRRPSSPSAVVCLLATLTVTPAAAQAPAATYEEVASVLKNWRARSDSAAAVQNLVIRRDAGRFTLEQGTLYLLPPVAGRIVGAVFVGTGTFAFSAPTAIEADQLERFLEKRELAEPLKAAVLLFGDSTMQELERQLTFSAQRWEGDAESAVKDALSYLKEPESDGYDPDVFRTLLNPTPNGLFYAHVVRRSGDPVMFAVNPYQTEAVQVLRKAKIRRRRIAEVIARFPAVGPDGTRRPTGPGERVGDATVSHYELELWLPRSAMGNLSFSARARMALAVAGDRDPWVPFWLSPELNVDSARWSDGRPAAVTKVKKASTLWIRRPEASGRTVADTLEVFYSGDLIDRFSSFFFVRDFWYPLSMDPRSPATFDITYHSPSSYGLASVGTRVETRTRDNVTISRWRVEAPIRSASFNIGRFEELAMPADSGPGVTLLYSEEGHRELYRMIGYPGTGKVNEQAVAQDLSQSLRFFSRLYGPPPGNTLLATEHPYSHGEAHPGLLHLAAGTFEPARDSRGEEDVFRAHEVAHQWWGIGVDFSTYHDQWLSEGFAEFSGLWYMQTARRKNDLYFGMLRRWRDLILERRGGAAGEDAEVGPISLGYRTASSTSPDAYGLTVYLKGAWVLHMLRILMLDLRTMNEDPFTAGMREFYGSFNGKRASTDEFRAIVERHAGIPLDWFFDQWVHGTGIPTYTVAHQVRTTDDGKWRVRLRVKQTGVPGSFRMYVPVSIDLGNNRFARMRVRVEGPLTELDLPVVLPAQPVGLKFNELEGVLAEVKTEKW